MSWRDLLQSPDEEITVPWTGESVIRDNARTWALVNKPPEFGWYSFKLNGRTASFSKPADSTSLPHKTTGYLIGDRLVPNTAKSYDEPLKLIATCERVYLIEPGLDRFVRVSAGRTHENGKLVFLQLEMPLGSEDEVRAAFLESLPILHIKNVVPQLYVAYTIEDFHRKETVKRREEQEKLAKLEAERLEREAKFRKLSEQAGTGKGRRDLAKIDFAAAAKSALAVSGAVFLEHKAGYNRNETVVRFRLDGARYECVCNTNTLQIIDAGICLTDHYTGVKGDMLLTLESLPGVILEADRTGKLHIFRHVY